MTAESLRLPAPFPILRLAEGSQLKLQWLTRNQTVTMRALLGFLLRENQAGALFAYLLSSVLLSATDSAKSDRLLIFPC